ncbi:MAG: hypothetical protein DMF51_06000 [Acidobacteria bacterium]|nr:MAG: hypothetical protein DMF51_06000 [Acidobacteriota bacterium]
MATCASCSTELSEGARRCPACGSALDSASSTPTRSLVGRTGPVMQPSPARETGLADSPDPYDQSRFLPGAVVAGRYRIVGLVGRGGMGEVYRADDLKLGQPVALKFLPESLAGDATRLARFLGEVRMARQVSHSSVCRVYDIGETDHLHFISMEYVDGEDLASLLRRIGRLPQDKAVVVARQICAGLSAAHEKGILHRDLKPANVMIDGRGHVRITDFGLAVLVDSQPTRHDRAGTPYYMAPEQLAGDSVSVQSDLYALGLILYELFTGRPAFSAGSAAELARVREESTPPSPASRVEGLDPGIVRVILRCLERNPRDRPVSALAVAAALPGGNPLRAALEAGETPSPELVAAAGEKGGLEPRQAWLCFSGIAAGLVAVVGLAGSSQLTAYVPLELPPQVLEHRAREIIRKLGYSAPLRDSSSGFSGEGDYLRYLERTDRSPRRWEALRSGRPAAISFWYRQSPRLLVPSLYGRRWPDKDDPPLTTPGMQQVVLDTQGRLTYFTAVPLRSPQPAAGGESPDWAGLLAEAGFKPETVRPVPPDFLPPVYADTRAAWEGTLPDVAVPCEPGAGRSADPYRGGRPRGPAGPLRDQVPVAERAGGRDGRPAILGGGAPGWLGPLCGDLLDRLGVGGPEKPAPGTRTSHGRPPARGVHLHRQVAHMAVWRAACFGPRRDEPVPREPRLRALRFGAAVGSLSRPRAGAAETLAGRDRLLGAGARWPPARSARRQGCLDRHASRCPGGDGDPSAPGRISLAGASIPNPGRACGSPGTPGTALPREPLVLDVDQRAGGRAWVRRVPDRPAHSAPKVVARGGRRSALYVARHRSAGRQRPRLSLVHRARHHDRARRSAPLRRPDLGRLLLLRNPPVVVPLDGRSVQLECGRDPSGGRRTGRGGDLWTEGLLSRPPSHSGGPSAGLSGMNLSGESGLTDRAAGRT